MARETREYPFTIPAGTPIANPTSMAIDFPVRVVREIDIRVPPGPRGEVGFSIGSAGTPVIPLQAGAWIVTDDEVIKWPLDGYWDSGSWEVFGYNTGTYDHTLYFTFRLDLVGSSSPSVTPALPSAALSSPVGTSTPQPAVIGGSLVMLPVPVPAVILPAAP